MTPLWSIRNATLQRQPVIGFASLFSSGSLARRGSGAADLTIGRPNQGDVISDSETK